jgi:predicted nucleic-acid-binding Zn-ribbon protein
MTMVCYKCGYSGTDILVSCDGKKDIVQCPKCGNQQEQDCDIDDDIDG